MKNSTLDCPTVIVYSCLFAFFCLFFNCGIRYRKVLIDGGVVCVNDLGRFLGLVESWLWVAEILKCCLIE